MPNCILGTNRSCAKPGQTSSLMQHELRTRPNLDLPQQISSFPIGQQWETKKG